MTDVKLRPCPLDGGKAEFIMRHSSVYREGVYVACKRKSCRCSTKVFATRALAAAAWNTRSESLVEKAAGEMREALGKAEIALLNCIPIKPYTGDGPLVELRKTMAAYDAVKEGK
jgi:hypothetical protein